MKHRLWLYVGLIFSMMGWVIVLFADFETVVSSSAIQPAEVGPLGWSPLGDTIAVVTISGILLYDANNLENPPDLLEYATGVSFMPDAPLVFNPEGTFLASAIADDEMIDLWDVQTHTSLARMKASKGITSLTFSNDGSQLFAGNSGGSIYVWNINELNTISSEEPVVDFEEWILDIDLNHRWIATSPPNVPDVIVLYELGEVLNGTSRWGTLGVHSDRVEIGVFSPDGDILATVSAGSGQDVYLWNVSTLEVSRRKRLAVIDGAWRRVVFSPDGQLIATDWVSSESDTAIKIWSVEKALEQNKLEQGDELYTFSGHTDRISGFDFSPSGDQLASISRDGKLRLWDILTGSEMSVISLPAQSD